MEIRPHAWAICPGLHHPPREGVFPKVQVESTKLSLGLTAPEKVGTAFTFLGNEHNQNLGHNQHEMALLGAVTLCLSPSEAVC